MSADLVGAVVFGTVVGYLVHYLVRRDREPGVGDIGAIIGVVLGGGVLKVVSSEGMMSWYLIGLGIGFFLYWLALMAGREKVPKSPAELPPLPLFPFA